MLELTEADIVDKDYHWVLKLVNYPSHPLQELIKQFTPQARELFQSAYLYIGELPNNKKNKTICILHFHSDLPGHTKFMNMQNLESYKSMVDLNKDNIAQISRDITRDTVIPLGTSDALSSWHLDKIYQAHYFFIADETGFTKEIQWD